MAKFIKVLRSAAIYETYDAAVSALTTQLGQITDGEIAISSYGTGWDNANTIFGFVRESDGKRSYTIYEPFKSSDIKLGDGLHTLNDKISIKIDAESDSYLTVSANGLKLSGLKDAFEQVIQDLTVSKDYEKTTYSDPFEEKVETAKSHVASGDKLDAAFKKIETTISLLVDEVLANEEVTAAEINDLAEAAGTVNEKGVITYIPETNAKYIGGAKSVHEATVILDAKLNEVSNSVNVKVVSEDAGNALTKGTDGGAFLNEVWDAGEY